MTTTPLSQNEQANSGFTHKLEIPYTDLSGTAGTAKTIALLTLTAGQLIAGGAIYMPTTFTDGAATMSSMTLKIGLDFVAGAPTADDDDCLLEAVELEATGTELIAKDFNGASFATKRTGEALCEGATCNAIFTSTGANLSTLTAGKVVIFMKIVDLSKL